MLAQDEVGTPPAGREPVPTGGMRRRTRPPRHQRTVTGAPSTRDGVDVAPVLTVQVVSGTK